MRGHSGFYGAGIGEAGQARKPDQEAVPGPVRQRGLQDYRPAAQGAPEQANAPRKRKFLFQLIGAGFDSAAVADLEGPAWQEQGQQPARQNQVATPGPKPVVGKHPPASDQCQPVSPRQRRETVPKWPFIEPSQATWY